MNKSNSLSEPVVRTIIRETIREELDTFKKELVDEVRQDFRTELQSALNRQTEILKTFMKSISAHAENHDHRINKLEKAFFS